MTHGERHTRSGRDVRHTKIDRKGQEGMFKTQKKADKARKGCLTHGKK